MRLACATTDLVRALSLAVAGLALVGCERIPGRPGPGRRWCGLTKCSTFPTLYKANCAGCHGENGRNGAAISLANPVYLAVAGEENLREITAKGVSGKLMPPFAKSAGGMLTDQQINVLAHGMMQQWSKPDLFAAQEFPPYSATSPGDAARGQAGFWHVLRAMPWGGR